MGRLSGLDVAFLCLESRTRPMHMGAVAVFRATRPLSDARLRSVLAERAARIPALCRRLESTRFPPGGARWEPTEGLDLAGHVHGYRVTERRTSGHAVIEGGPEVRPRNRACPPPAAHPKPSSEGSALTRDSTLLEAYAAGWLATPLDLHRPPWDLHLVTGLPDDRFAVLLKLHHALADGAGAVGIGAGLLDGGGAPPVAEPPPEPPLSEVLRQAAETAAMAGTVLRAARKPPMPALLAAGSSAHRRVALIRLDAADVRQIRRQHGGTTNDVVLAILAGGLRDWLRTRDLPVDGLTPRALIPVNTRPRATGAGGNHLSGYLCDLPVSVADPVARLRAVRSAMDRNKAAGPEQGAGVVPILAGRIPPALHRICAPAAGAATPLLFDTVVTNVPLPRVPLTLAGAPLCEVYPFAPLAPGHAVGIGISTYRDAVHIGLQSDRDAVPDTDVLAHAIVKSATTLHELCA